MLSEGRWEYWKLTYERVKKALMNQGYLSESLDVEELKRTRTVPLPPAEGNHNPLLRELAGECIKIESDTDKTPQQKYIRLLYFGFQKYIQAMGEFLDNGQGKETDYQRVKPLKKFLDDTIKNKEDITFFVRYEMSDDVLNPAQRNKIWKEVYQGQKTIPEASEEIKRLAYQKYLKTEDVSIRKRCVQIILADRVSDIEELNKLCQFDSQGKSFYHDALYYGARAIDEPQYAEYRDTLNELLESDAEVQTHLPEMMKQLFSATVNEANKLYQDEKIPEEEKAHCHNLLVQMASFRKDVARIRSLQENLSSVPEAKRDEYKQEIKDELKALEKKSKKLNSAVNTLSSDTSRKKWGKIILFSGLIIALGIVTFGFGFGFGFGEMVSSLRSESEFFKTNKDYNAITNQARELLKQSNTLALNLDLPDEGIAIEPGEIEMLPPPKREG